MSLLDFFRRRRSDTDDGVPASMFDEIDQEHEHELARIGEYLDGRLEGIEVDVRRRKFAGRSGKASGITELARSIHADEPGMAVDDIEQGVIDWLEQSYCPGEMSQARMEKLQAKIGDWVDDHQRGATDEPS